MIKRMGEQDVFLVGNPDISYFKKVYRRHTRFSKDYRQYTFDNSDSSVNFGQTLTSTIRRYGDLIGEMYIEAVITGNSAAANQYTVNHFGNSLIQEASVKIGGREIDKLTGEWLQIYKELYTTNNQLPEIAADNSNTGGGKKHVFNMDYTEAKYTTPGITILDTWTMDDRVEGDCPLVFGGLSNDSNVDSSMTWTYDETGGDQEDLWTSSSAHGLEINDKLEFIAVGGGASGYSINTVYYVVAVPTTTTLQLSNTPGGSAIEGTGDSTGTWTAKSYSFRELLTDNYGSYATSTSYSKKIKVPLRFFFNNHPGLALPMCALTNDEVQFKLVLESSANLKGDVTTLTLTSVKLFIETYYLSDEERTRFTNGTHMYLIEQLQRKDDTACPTYSSGTQTEKLSIDLNSFNHPVKYITWAVQEEPNGGTKGIGPCYFRSMVPNSFHGNDGCYSKQNTGTFELFLDDETVNNETSEMDYHTRTLMKRFCKNRIPDLDRIGIYSFALNPLNLDPSGTCNFSMFNRKRIDITLSGNNLNSTKYSSSKKLLIYAVNYNILQITSGKGGLLYI